MPDKYIKEFVDNVLPYWWLWAFWWAALYLHKVRGWMPFKIIQFMINIFLSAWIWVTVYFLLPETLGVEKISIVTVSWFLSYPILFLLEEEWLNLILKKLWLQWVTKKSNNTKK